MMAKVVELLTPLTLRINSKQVGIYFLQLFMDTANYCHILMTVNLLRVVLLLA